MKNSRTHLFVLAIGPQSRRPNWLATCVATPEQGSRYPV